MSELTEETAKELVWAIRGLTDAVQNYARVKERGIKLAERIEDDKAIRGRVWLYE